MICPLKTKTIFTICVNNCCIWYFSSASLNNRAKLPYLTYDNLHLLAIWKPQITRVFTRVFRRLFSASLYNSRSRVSCWLVLCLSVTLGLLIRSVWGCPTLLSSRRGRGDLVNWWIHQLQGTLISRYTGLHAI